MAGGTSQVELHMGGSVPVETRGEGSAQEEEGMWHVAGVAGIPTGEFPRFLQGTEDLSAKSVAFPHCLLCVHRAPWEER